jgi:hypothetical protein
VTRHSFAPLKGRFTTHISIGTDGLLYFLLLLRFHDHLANVTETLPEPINVLPEDGDTVLVSNWVSACKTTGVTG